MVINGLTPRHIALGIEKLRENNISDGEYESTNPVANMMNMFRGCKIPRTPKKNKYNKPKEKNEDIIEPRVEELSDEEICVENQYPSYSDKSEVENVSDILQSAISDESIMNNVIDNILQTHRL
jgi:hypothetical protein